MNEMPAEKSEPVMNLDEFAEHANLPDWKRRLLRIHVEGPGTSTVAEWLAALDRAMRERI
jgi:hypothetical protein